MESAPRDARCSTMGEVYITTAVRSPVGIGKAEKGDLYPLDPIDLAARVLRAAAERAEIDPRALDDVLLGCVTPIGDQGANIGRLAALYAGFPAEVPGLQLNRMCGSAQQAVHFAAQAILAGDADLVLAGGVEMMSHQPMGSDYPDKWPQDFPYPLVHQGESAERMADRWRLSREQLDDYSCRSHVRAGTAHKGGFFEQQILPLDVPQEDGSTRVVTRDQGVRAMPDREKMAQLPPVFRQDGVITAGNSSQISDAAAVLLLASPQALAAYNLTPMARLTQRVVVGSDPVLMLDGPIAATQRALAAAGLDTNDIDVFEINEAFASVVLAWAEELEPDLRRVNPNGGAIAHGHPLGATGAVLMTKLIYELQRRGGGVGLQAMCIGHGMATASILRVG